MTHASIIPSVGPLTNPRKRMRVWYCSHEDKYIGAVDMSIRNAPVDVDPAASVTH